MELRLSYDQRARLELLAIHAGSSPEQLQLSAAQLLLDRDASDTPFPSLRYTQQFLSQVEFEERLARLLGR